MDSSRELRELLELATASSRLSSAASVLETSLPTLLSVGGADSILVLRASGHDDGLRPSLWAGMPLDPDATVVDAARTASGDIVDAPVPAAWRASGLARVAVRRLPGEHGLLVVGWTATAGRDTTALQLGLAQLDGQLARFDPATARWHAPEDLSEYERRQALEINDNVVQGLVAAAYALDQGRVAEGSAYLNRTLNAARAMMDELLEPLQGAASRPATWCAPPPRRSGAGQTSRPSPRRRASTPKTAHRARRRRRRRPADALRARMERRNGLTVVGEAADGLAAVELASELQPDLVMLDLAMPRMDGLEALPLIRAAVPGVRVIVLSASTRARWPRRR